MTLKISAPALVALGAALFHVPASASLSATATFTDTQIDSTDYSYQITLNNTGDTTIGTFWFGWVPGAGFLSSTPTDISSPSGWTESVTNSGAAVQWKTSSSLLAAGSSLSGFSFESTESPAQLLSAYGGSGTGAGDTVSTAFVYIGAPLADPGYQLVVGAAPVPLPAPFGLLGAGLAGLASLARRRRFTV